MKAVRDWFWAPFIALQFLTRIPAPFVPEAVYRDSGGLRRSLVFFPLIGVVTGGLAALAIVAARLLGLPALAASIVGIGAGALVTGCFHEDGLADTADAAGVAGRERALEVMRDSRIGTFGSVALWFLLSLKAALLTSIGSPELVAVATASHALARWSSLPLALVCPSARKGNGLGAGLSDLISRREVMLGTLVMLIAVAAFCGLEASLALTAVTIVVLGVCGLYFRRRFGGITGDCLGAANQVVELAVLATVVASPSMQVHLI